MKLLCLYFTFILALTAQAEEGFSDLSMHSSSDVIKSFSEFPEKNECGSVRIHKNKPYYLSALHCFRQNITPSKEVRIGSLLNYDFLVYYGDLTGKIINLKNFDAKVLKNGSCWTGFALDVFSKASTADVIDGIECLSGDWVIFERLDTGGSSSCIPTLNSPYLSGETVTTIGGPRGKVKRNTGLLKLTGRAFSTGLIHTIDDLLRSPHFPLSLKKLWKQIPDYQTISEALVLTTSDIVGGMSGGPVIERGKIVGISTVALLPNFIYDYPGLVGLQEGYNYGVHGAVPADFIKNKEPSYFFCP